MTITERVAHLLDADRAALQFTPDSAARESIMGKANTYGEYLAQFYTAGALTRNRCEADAQRATNALRKEIDHQLAQAYLRGCVDATEKRSA